MKKYIKLLILVLILVLIIFSIYIIFQSHKNKHINYTSIGDGLSLGIDSYGNVDYGYSDYIKDYLEKNDQLNMYVKKYTSEEMSINDLKNMILIDKKMNYKNRKINIKNILSESDIITMSIGLNDLIYKMSILDTNSITKINKIIDEIYQEFKNLIQEIRKYYNEDIYLIGYYQSKKYDYKTNYAIEKLNDKYKNCKEVIFIDTNYFLSNNEKYLKNPNSYYPNYNGYQAISSKIIGKISKKLEK